MRFFRCTLKLVAAVTVFTLAFPNATLGVVILQHEYAQIADGSSVTDGLRAGSGAVFTSAELFDDSGFEPDVSLCGGDTDCENDIRQIAADSKKGQFNVWNNTDGPTLNYAVESLPGPTFQNGGSSVTFTPQEVADGDVPGWDGNGVRSEGNIFVRYFGGDPTGLNLTGPFSAFIRVNPQSGRNMTLNGPNQRQNLFGSGTSSGWGVYLDDGIEPPPEEGRGGGGEPTEATLNIQFGRQVTNPGTSEAMETGLPLEQRPVIRYGEWVDIAIVFDGDCDDNSDPFACDADSGVVDPNNIEDDENVKIYVNGKLAGSVTGAASFNTNSGGIRLATPGDSFGNQPLNAFVDRVAFWNAALTGEQIAALSPVFDKLAADFNKDGRVDGDDFLFWQQGFGTMSGAEQLDGDADGDGDVDGDDFLVWQQQFGSGGGAGAASVPEPASAALLLVFAPLVAALRRRQR